MHYVYFFLNSNREIIYIGRTNNIEKRMKSHFLYGGHLVSRAYLETKHVVYIELPTLVDSKIKEIYYINYYKPRYNTADKQDDMMYRNRIWEMEYLNKFKF